MAALIELQPGTAVDPERVESVEDSSFEIKSGPQQGTYTQTTVRLFDGRSYAIERPYREILALVQDARRHRGHSSEIRFTG